MNAKPPTSREVSIPVGRITLSGTLTLPAAPRGIVLFAHGSGSSRQSPRNRFVADVLVDAGVATLLFDLLTPAEDRSDETRFDIPLLTTRLTGATAWLATEPALAALPIGYFGASTGAAAALDAAAVAGAGVRAVVSRGGRPDLAPDASLLAVRCPTLFIVGGADEVVLALNRRTMARMSGPVAMEVVPGATHLFEEPGALERVADLAREWFERHLG
jgi:dienelactone hydrolase